MSDEAPRVLDEILQHGERLGHQGDAGVSTPQALVRDVEAERIEHSWRIDSRISHLTTSLDVTRTSLNDEQLERSADCCGGREQYFRLGLTGTAAKRVQTQISRQLERDFHSGVRRAP